MNIKYLLLLLLIVFQSVSYSQEKPKKYYNVDFKEIEKSTFDTFLAYKEYYYSGFDLEDQQAYVIYQRKVKGKLSEENLRLLNEYLV